MISICNKIKISYTLILLVLTSFLSGLFKDVLVFLFFIIIHELGHIIFSVFFRWKIKYIRFNICGGFIYYDDIIDKSFKQGIIISLAGIMFQNIIFILIFIMYKNNMFNDRLFYMMLKYNFAISIFNILPIIPLDGSKLLEILLNKYLPYKLSLKILNFISFIFLLLIFLFFIINKKIEYSYIIMFSFLIKKIYLFFKNIPYLFNRFLLERYIKPINNRKYEYINGDKLYKMKRQKKHYFKINDNYYSENEILSKKFD